MAVRHRANIRARTADDRDIAHIGLVSRCQSLRQSSLVAALRASCPVDGRSRIPSALVVERQSVGLVAKCCKCVFQLIVRNTVDHCHRGSSERILHFAANNNFNRFVVLAVDSLSIPKASAICSICREAGRCGSIVDGNRSTFHKVRIEFDSRFLINSF